jgi:hypothetical protein
MASPSITRANALGGDAFSGADALLERMLPILGLDGIRIAIFEDFYDQVSRVLIAGALLSNNFGGRRHACLG